MGDKVEDRDCHTVAELCSLLRRFLGMSFSRTQIQAKSQTNFSLGNPSSDARVTTADLMVADLHAATLWTPRTF
jgi:hypothetical protein